jgi:hypothetical protein
VNLPTPRPRYVPKGEKPSPPPFTDKQRMLHARFWRSMGVDPKTMVPLPSKNNWTLDPPPKPRPHKGEPCDWLWLGPDVRHMLDGSFREVEVKVCVKPGCGKGWQPAR